MAYPFAVVLHHLEPHDDLVAPTVIVAFDGWVDAGSAATTAAEQLIDGADVAATFENDLIFDYRARRPILEIEDGRPSDLTWPEIVLYRTRIGEKDVLVFTGHEPDYRWRELAESAVDFARQLDVSQWISLGAIPAAVPHTRPVPILGTESRPGLLRGDVQPGPEGLLRVPAAAISVLDMAVSAAGIPTVGYFAQIPHYMSGAYPGAASELLRVRRPASRRGDRPRRAARRRAQTPRSPRPRRRGRRVDPFLRHPPGVDGRRIAPAVGRRPHLGHRAVPARPG